MILNYVVRGDVTQRITSEPRVKVSSPVDFWGGVFLAEGIKKYKGLGEGGCLEGLRSSTEASVSKEKMSENSGATLYRT